MCLTCILIPLLTGLICALLGYLLGKLLSKKSSDLAVGDANLKIRELENDLSACKKNSASLQATIADLRKGGDLKMGVAAAGIPFDAKLAADVFGGKIIENDLKIVEGIGPKIEELFHGAGIKTWKQLADTSVEKCKEILVGGGERFTMHDPGTWPEQSELAYLGKWKELKDWQDNLKGGK